MEIMSFNKKRGNLYEIELNTGDRYKIYDDIILKHELLLDRKIDKKKLELILKENAMQDAYFKAIKFLNIKMRTKLEIERYLKRNAFGDEEINFATNRLKEEGAIDDKKYVDAFINDSILLTLDGPKKMKVSLGKLGIGDNLIDPVLEQIPNSTWIERIEKVLAKRAKINKDSEKMFKNKVSNALSMLGYSSELIRPIVEDFKIDTTESFLRDADKVYLKLDGKYNKTEVELRFKAKMYAKGYDGDAISDYLKRKGI